MTRRTNSTISFVGLKTLVAVVLVSTMPGFGPLAADDSSTAAVATFFEPFSVPLVSVDVLVMDRTGAPITGLTQADFEVFEDGRPMEITHFFVADRGNDGSSGGVARPRGPEATNQDLYLALYFDDSNVNPQRRAIALSHVADFFNRPLPANVKTALVRFDGTLHVESDFSNQPGRLLAALASIRSQTPIDYSRDAQSLIREMESAATGLRRSQAISSQVNPGRNSAQVDIQAEMSSNFAPQINAYARQSQLRNRASLTALERFVQSLRGISGRKAVLWVGSFEMRPGESLFREWQQLFPGGMGRQGNNPLMAAMRYDMTPEVRDLIDNANSHRVSFYTLGPVATRRGAGVSSEMRTAGTSSRAGNSGRRDAWGEEEAQQMMSDLTGGRMLADSADLDQQLEQVSAELGNYYSLAYPPPSPGTGENRKITVKASRDDAILSYRRSYQDLGEQNRTADRTMAAAVLGVVDNPLGIAVECGQQEAREDGNFLVPVTIRIPIGELVLVPDAENHAAQVSVFSVVRDDRGGLSDVHERAYPIQIDNNTLLTAVAQQAEFVLGMVLRQGTHRIAVGVRDDGSSTDSTAYVDITVGASQTDGSSG